MISANETNLVNAKKKANFKIKYQLGTFICNYREAGHEADLILQSMKFIRSFLWRYDHLEFITKKRQKVRLGPFIHHHIPKTEAYANQSEWVEGTLIDQENTRTKVENALINLEENIDEDSFLQVPEESEVPKESVLLGKSNVPDQSDTLKKSDRQDTSMSNPPVVQTLLNEERSLKRNREGATTSARASSQAYAETSQAKR